MARQNFVLQTVGGAGFPTLRPAPPPPPPRRLSPSLSLPLSQVLLAEKKRVKLSWTERVKIWSTGEDLKPELDLKVLIPGKHLSLSQSFAHTN